LSDDLACELKKDSQRSDLGLRAVHGVISCEAVQKQMRGLASSRGFKIVELWFSFMSQTLNTKLTQSHPWARAQRSYGQRRW